MTFRYFHQAKLRLLFNIHRNITVEQSAVAYNAKLLQNFFNFVEMAQFLTIEKENFK